MGFASIHTCPPLHNRFAQAQRTSGVNILNIPPKIHVCPKEGAIPTILLLG